MCEKYRHRIYPSYWLAHYVRCDRTPVLWTQKSCGKDTHLLGCDTVSFGAYLPTIWRTVVPFRHQQLLAKRHSITYQKTRIFHLPQHCCKNVTHHRSFQEQKYKRVASHIMQAVSCSCNIWTTCHADRHPFNRTGVKVKTTLYPSAPWKRTEQMQVRILSF